MDVSRTTWYLAPKKDAHDAVFQQISYIRTQQNEQRTDWVDFEELYASGNVTGLGVSQATSRYFHIEETEDGAPEVRFNVSAMGVDTAISLISQAPVVPVYLTTDGDFSLIRKADKCSNVLQGQMDRHVQAMIKRAALDSTKVGTGFLFGKFDIFTGKSTVEREHALNVYVEHLDGINMAPRSMHRGRFVPKETLAAQYPAFATKIEMCSGVTRTSQNDLFLQGLGNNAAFHEFVEIIESWHLRPGPKGKGRHTICIANATLRDEEYKHDDFPVAVFRYRERAFGFYGSGLIESGRPCQNRINAMIRRNARAQDLGSNLIIMNPNGEDSVSVEDITNDIGLVINYQPAIGPPTIAKWDGTLDGLNAQVDLDIQRWLMAEGISPDQANGGGAGKGLDSGVAIRATDDVQSRRLVPYTSRFQDSCTGVAQLFERMNDDCAAKDPSFAITSEGAEGRRTFLRTAKWVEIRPPKGDARLQMAQMSALPTTPQGRWAAVQEWVQAGFASRQYAMNLLQFPDLDQYASTELAHLDYARWQIIQILDGEDPLPDPRQDLNLAVDLATKSKLKAATMKADENTLQRFEDFLVYLEELIAQSKAPVAGPVGQAPMDPTLQLPIGPKGVVAPGVGMGGGGAMAMAS